MLDTDIEELAAMVQKARHTVLFTGAGMSTECGIPDFRSPGGFWTAHKPIQFQDFVASEMVRIEAWTRFFGIHDAIINAVPGAGHRAVADLVNSGRITHVITQNIDDMHARSGVPRERIIEIHGNGTYAACLGCGKRHTIDWARAAISEAARAPACVACGGIVKSATISFGQAMPDQPMADARAATLDADLFLSVGSSLQVFPAAGFPVLAKQNRAPLVIINREPTGLDGLADLTIRHDLSAVLTRLARRLKL